MKKLLSAVLCLSVVGCSGPEEPEKAVNVLLIGGGVMSASLGTYLRELEPEWNIDIYERLDGVGLESSNGWNNAGTGHSAFCELNYTPEKADGSIDITKAVKVAEAFEISRQFWSHQIRQGVMQDPQSFINDTPHISFVWGDDNIDFLHKRYETLQTTTLFQGMAYSENPDEIRHWAPLLMEGRDPAQKVAATRMPIGTDVNYGEVTRQLMAGLTRSDKVKLHLQQEVRDLEQNDDKTWNVTVADLAHGGEERVVRARFVFIGAGGGALPLLQKAGIPEGEGYAGFPVGGQFLYTTNQDVVQRHLAKAYGKAGPDAPPMSTPHLDRRLIDGQPALLFGPFATFSTKFLKNGSLMDLPKSITTDNLMPMMHAGMDNLSLSTYLIGQLMMSREERIEQLHEYFPNANADDWKLVTAGQRVQIIKKDDKLGGKLQFGTEVVAAADGSLAALLGASPGASTAAPIMLSVLEQTFKDKIASPAWQAKLKEIIPSYGRHLNGDIALTNEIRGMTGQTLGLHVIHLQDPSQPEAAPETPEEASAEPAEEAAEATL